MVPQQRRKSAVRHNILLAKLPGIEKSCDSSNRACLSFAAKSLRRLPDYEHVAPLGSSLIPFPASQEANSLLQANQISDCVSIGVLERKV